MKKKFIVEPSFFHKLDNNKCKIHTGARARKQKYISIYLSLCMKTFLKTGTLAIVQLVKKLGSTINFSFVGFFVPICQ